MFRKPTPSFAVSVVALVFAAGGTATAAAVIDSSDIKNNSVTSADIKNSSVQGKDLKNGTITLGKISKSARDSLKGQNGANGQNGAPGAPGQQGAQGPQGPRGVVTPAYFTNGNKNIPAGPSSTQIIEGDPIPAGKYVITGKTVLSSASVQRLDCNLAVGPVIVDSGLWDATAVNARSTMTLTAVADVPTNAKLQMRCSHSGEVDTPGGSAGTTKIVAIPVS